MNPFQLTLVSSVKTTEAAMRENQISTVFEPCFLICNCLYVYFCTTNDFEVSVTAHFGSYPWQH